MNINIKIISLVALIITIARNDCTASDLVYGPYSVGFESYKTYDNSRPYILGKDTISRPLLIHFWYPSKEKIEGHTLDFKHYIDLIAQREDYGKLTSEIDENSFNYVYAYSEFAKAHLGLDTSISSHEILDSPVYAKSGIPIQKIGTGFPLLIYVPSIYDSSSLSGMDKEYILQVNDNHSSITAFCNTLLDNNLDYAISLMNENNSELFADETQVNILARMFIDSNIDLTIWLYLNNLENHPDSWQAHYNLGYVYKENGATLLAKEELLKAKELNQLE